LNLWQNLREIWEMLTANRRPPSSYVSVPTPENQVGCAITLAFCLAVVIAFVVSTGYEISRHRVMHAGLKTGSAIQGLCWLVFLVVAIIFINCVITTSTVERKKQYAFMGFFLASIFAVLLFIPFMAQGRQWNTQIGVYMGGCVLAMICCFAGWPIAFSMYKTIVSKAFGLLKIIKGIYK